MSDRQEQQLTLWEYISPKFKLKQPIILLEMFAGIGAQHKALSILGVEIDKEKSKICEWAYNSYCGYNAIHIKDKTDYSQGKTKEELIERVKGTSTNYNDPLSLEQLNKKPIEWLRNAYNNIVATHNLVNVMEVKGSDLGELPKDQTSILTYSFPCQDLSLAGKRQGMATSQADGGTRSGLLWEIERILLERKQQNLNLPTILLMENVPEVVGKGNNNIGHFKKWEQRLRQFGYSNYVEILNGRDYGIPQNRRRCFMVSILGDYAYDFPCKVPLKYKLKDFLEKKVDEKYYLDEETIERISHWKAQQKPLENAIDVEQGKVSPTLTARGAGEEHSGMVLVKENLFQNNEIVDFDSSDDFRRVHNNYESPSVVCHSKLGIVEIGNYSPSGHNAARIVDSGGLAPTVMENHGTITAIVEKGIPIKNYTKQGYSFASDGDAIDISTRMEHHRGTVQKGRSQTLTCKGGENVGVVVDEKKHI